MTRKGMGKRKIEKGKRNVKESLKKILGRRKEENNYQSR